MTDKAKQKKLAEIRIFESQRVRVREHHNCLPKSLSTQYQKTKEVMTLLLAAMAEKGTK